MHLHQQRKKKIYSQFLFGTLYGKARWRNPVLFKSNFLSCVFLTYIFRFSPCFSKTIYFLYLLFIYGILTMCSMLRIMSKFAMFSSHITFIIINFGSLVVKLKKAEIRYSQSHCIFFNHVSTRKYITLFLFTIMSNTLVQILHIFQETLKILS